MTDSEVSILTELKWPSLSKLILSKFCLKTDANKLTAKGV
jgi:hypothetical protein